MSLDFKNKIICYETIGKQPKTVSRVATYHKFWRPHNSISNTVGSLAVRLPVSSLKLQIALAGRMQTDVRT
jgi:hypothetical protein